MRQKTDKTKTRANRPFVGLLTVLGSVVVFLAFLVLITMVIHFVVM